jgi:hypothetical protein
VIIIEHIDNLTKMMSGSLGLTELWYVMGEEFNEDELALHIHMESARRRQLLAQVRGADQAKRLNKGG